jgi:hypothetical protein
MNKAEKFAQHLTGDMAEVIGKRSPEMQKMIALVGKDKMSRMWQARVYDLAVNHRKDFDVLAKSFETYIQNRDAGDERIREACKKYGIKESAYVHLRGIENNWERWKTTRDEIRSSYGMFKSVMDKITLGRMAAFQAVRFDFGQRREVEASLKSLETDMSVLGDVLRGTIDANDMIRQAFAQEIISEKKPLSHDIDFQEGRALMANEASMLKEWKKRRPADFDTLTDVEKDKARDGFMDAFKKEYEGTVSQRKGFWAKVIAGMATLLFGSFDKKKLV